MKKLTYSLLIAAIAAAYISCSNDAKQTAKKEITEDDFLWQNMDSSVKPGDDFFKFAVGTWIKKNPIPETERGWGIYNLVQNETYDRMKKVCEEAAADAKAEKGSNSQKIGDFWVAAMDSAKCDKEGIVPLQPELERINSIKDKQSLIDAVAYYQMIGVGALFAPAIFQDEKNSSQYAVHLYQGGIGLPNRDYYFNNDARTKNIREEYVKHLSNMFGLLGDDEATAKKHSDIVMKIETDLARASRKLEALRDPYKNYKKMSLEEMNKLTPAINWKDMLAKMGVANVNELIVGQPEFYQQVQKSLSTVSIDDWKTYLRWNIVSGFSECLGEKIDKENFHFYSTVLSGIEKLRPRWKRTLDLEENYMGDMLGQLYVKNYVPAAMKKRYEDLTDNMFSTYKERIQQLEWMTDVTKTKAIEKLSKVQKKVCYPEKWKDYSALNIDKNSFLQNVINCNRWQFNFYVNKLGKPVDRTEWDMTPQTYNAYYNPSNNEIVLPAAQFIIPGLPDSLADDAIIYGYAAASTIGHEITHGFDDQGRQFDASGNLSPWWTSEDSVQFAKRAKLLVEQFSNYVVLDSLHINGEATLGENIADLGGIVIGYAAFKKTVEGKSDTLIDGMTADQRYFLGYTLGWLGSRRPQAIARQVMTDVHSPAFLRVNGPFADVPEFYKAFNIQPGDAMYRPDSMRVKIW